jgi:hypothetical protein
MKDLSNGELELLIQTAIGTDSQVTLEKLCTEAFSRLSAGEEAVKKVDGLKLALHNVQCNYALLKERNEMQSLKLLTSEIDNKTLVKKVAELEVNYANAMETVVKLQSERRNDCLDGQSEMEIAYNRIAELENEIKEWENSRDGFLFSSQEKNFKIMELEKEVERLEGRHCADCCCDKSWKALGITEYTGKSIPEHIAELMQQAASGQRAVEAMDRIIKCMDNNWLDGMVVIIQEYKEAL